MNKHTTLLVLILILGLAVFFIAETVRAPEEPEGLQDPNGTPESLSHDAAERTGFQFMQDLIAVAPPQNDPEAGERLYNVLSERAQEEIARETLAGDVARFVGVQDVPDQGVSVEDLQVKSDDEVMLVVGLNYSGGRTLRGITLIVEDGAWRVDRVSLVEEPYTGGADDSPDLPPVETPDTPAEEPTSTTPTVSCAVAGCSSQLCVSAEEAQDIVTTCEWREEYACYRDATCEVQADGACGWTMTEELTTCLSNAGRDTM